MVEISKNIPDINDLSPDQQADLLRKLEAAQEVRVGASSPDAKKEAQAEIKVPGVENLSPAELAAASSNIPTDRPPIAKQVPTEALEASSNPQAELAKLLNGDGDGNLDPDAIVRKYITETGDKIQ
jgi:hypothetical protein